MITVDPNEHTFSCVKVERFVEPVEITSRGTGFGNIIFGMATPELPPSIIFPFLMNAIHASYHKVLFARERDDFAPSIDIAGPVA